MSVRWRDVLKIHPAVELFPPLDPDEMRALGDDIRKHGLHEPVVVMRQYRRREGGTMDVREYDLVLIDGRNRLDAMEAVGFTLVRDGKLDPTLGHKALGLEPLTGVAYAELDDDVDVYAFVVSRNIHRRHLTAEKKRELIAKLIKATPEKSDLQIAETVKASPTTVGTVRAKMESSGDVFKLDTRQDTKGRKQPAKRARAPRSEKPPPPAPPPAPARADIEQGSAGERERKDARIEELQADKRHLALKIEDLESETPEKEYAIKKLRYQNAKLKAIGPVLILAEKLRPIIESLKAEGKKNTATMSPTAVAILAHKLTKLVAEWTDKYPNKQ